MAVLNSRALKKEAAQRLSGSAPNPQKLILIYTLVLAALSLAASGLNLYLDQQISGTGGLSGVSTRSVLQTLQTMLSYFATFFSPFWNAGLLAAVISIVREQDADPRGLLKGFRRFPRVLSYTLLELLIMILVATLVSYIATYLYLLTPFSEGFATSLQSLSEADLYSTETIMAALPQDVMTSMALVIMGFFLIFFIPLYGFINYSMRLSLYLVMSNPLISAVGAMITSWRMMKGHRFQMLKLDLSFWWYFLLTVLVTVVANLDLILPMVGVALPVNETVAYFAALVLSILVQLALYTWKKLHVDTTYVLACEAIAKPEESQTAEA